MIHDHQREEETCAELQELLARKSLELQLAAKEVNR